MNPSDTHSSEATVALTGSATDERGIFAPERGPRADVGTRVGRYLVLEQIGRGGMGVVVRAYDPKLRREIALKLVHPRGGVGGPQGHARLLREAQSLARLSDPHVVAVYDAELTDQGVYIAMEYVEGCTLRTWLGQASRAWTDVLPVLSAVARGLVAAHAEGIVHRDIKPDNVLVSDSGRVRLTDFGLARERADLSSPSGSLGSADDHEPGDLYTEVGTVMGTPAYMAPEQHTGQSTDDRGDQYALCVMCWEALYGQRPFHAKDPAALYEAKRRGPPERPSARVPDWLHAAVVRGLAVDPAARWPSVAALLEAMERGQSRARRRRAAIALGVVLCMGAAGLAVQRWQRSTRVAQCEQSGESISQVWNASAQGHLHAALLGTQTPYAEQTAQKVMPWLDAQAAAWKDAQTGACLDANVHGTWSADVFDRATWCLDERRIELEALVTELSRGEPRSVEKAVQAAAGLADIAPCRDVDVLMRLPSPPTEQRDEVRSIRAQLAKAIASTRTGTYPEARRAAQQAVASAQTLGWAPLVAQARITLADVLGRTGDHAGAESEMEAAFFGAVEAGQPLVAATAAEELVYVVGYQRARHEDGLRWSRHAEALLVGQPDPGDLRLAKHLANRGGIAWARGDYDEALDLDTRALQLREAALGPEHPGIAASLNNLANARAGAGAFEEAAGLLERAITIWERSLGPDHPLVASSLSNLGGVLQQTGAYVEAKALAERALAIRQASLGAVHPDVADSLNNLAGIALMRGELEEARALFQRALDVSEQALGADHPDVARGLYNLATVQADLGEHDAAKALGERALAIREAKLGADHPDVAASLNGLANVCAELGAYEEAAAHFQRALAIWEKALGPEHPHLVYALVGMTELALIRDAPDEAVRLAERAVKLREEAAVPPADVARVRFLLAEALWAQGKDRPRARTLAESAQETYRQAGEAGKKKLADVTAWLATHE